ncbi:tRNA N(3)-methylcytidine methyltransferase METTL2A isoform X6 [Lutra lutra]|uniref:tRNA N(3)-methylcytidine methyltransferase METTL2A isoform X6 n=1 Tax=Lutra lutra TaxID=9657 RepID=UPI001FD32C28|nr:tRNA N(3)-methylcytidine methyltransferase METTL2A isoform X6 [Lutra lutra]
MADSYPECAPAAVGEKRQQFGSRFLSDPARVFHHNAWDNVEWSEEQAAAAERKVQENSTPRVCQEKQVDYEVNAHKYWNEFYKIHENGFFKDRHWLFTEFPELAPNPNHNDLNDWLSENKRSEVPEAIELVRTNSAYDPCRCFAFVHDLCDEDATYPVPGGSLDVIILIFVLSAVIPDKMQKAISRLSRLLKPGGMMLLRDYGRYDMAQLRFKKGQCLSESFYVRGDGTRVYFFTQGPRLDIVSPVVSGTKCVIKSPSKQPQSDPGPQRGGPKTQKPVASTKARTPQLHPKVSLQIAFSPSFPTFLPLSLDFVIKT